MPDPSDFSDANDAFSAIAGMLWSVFSRLRAEGASIQEAASLAAHYMAVVVLREETE